MIAQRKMIILAALASALFLVLTDSSNAEMSTMGRLPRAAYTFAGAYVYEDSPYGGYRGRPYGQRQAVATKQAARRILKQFFLAGNVRVGAIRERRFYFEAEITDRLGNIVDIVIIDKRTGRIRSIY